ncbi:hypothetical protein CBQ28_11885 [Pseudoalteromonas sp. GCY]|uniref:hypothetical protein n=1 Tax=Pseudoalteromonas TaxID=53246 RepID=UPI0005FA5B42|nr:MULTISPECIES: hypothetical protein [Pseudoalteromonas]AXQ98400.1 hypothetical protein D0N37_12110 [Pseudoalteromonas piscicida]KJY96732.1 hypothetical protein TW73_15975 [Pseudoalteromonas piscicida]MCO7201280.1 hypothetical protein [Pseudoalteromonas sp. OANN1]PHI36996.1 hypothetical protein CBQ28_11885 [Pseudoalteromonas sp. GCY]QQQ68388.1 hypothetical protein JJQ94_11535 [Pseudoalteromonas sp. GCY]
MSKYLLAGLLLSGGMSVHANATEQTIFDANTMCTAKQTTEGTRYFPPCAYSPTQVYAEQELSYSSPSIVRNGLFKTAIEYTFQCESIRPLSLRYSVESDGVASISNRISGAASSELNTIPLTHGFSNSYISFEAMSGITGFQAIKPGCKLVVSKVVTYPEPTYFNQVASSLSSWNSTLSTMINISTPSTGYLTLLNSIDNTLDTLEFVLFEVEDPITIEQLNSDISQLRASKQILEQNCRAGTSAQLCTAELANIRSYANSSILLNEMKAQDLYRYINSQVNWLADKSIGRDYSMLSLVKNKLARIQ